MTQAPARFRKALLDWFDRHKRDLPWRKTRDPYAIWLAEVMLQQTQVATAVPYYERFLARFPTAGSLAGASLDDVLALWKGLGYYSRARSLHRAAKLVAEAGLPTTVEGLRHLPGFGPYTAAAVASIAFGARAAAVDGNVLRVVARLLALEGPVDSRGLQDRVRAEVGRLLDPSRPGAFNEAMMELGATICVPREPACPRCPVASFCAARARGIQGRIPPPRVRRAPKRLDLACAVVRSRGTLLLARREEAGLFGGLWELPCAPIAKGESGADALKALGLRALDLAPAGVVARALTHRRLFLHLWPCAAPRRRIAGYLAERRVPIEEVGRLGVSTAMARAIERAVETDLGAQRRVRPSAGGPSAGRGRATGTRRARR